MWAYSAHQTQRSATDKSVGMGGGGGGGGGGVMGGRDDLCISILIESSEERSEKGWKPLR